jgi:DNA invertase Pin-like site-specific DNA recombinase
MTNPNDNSLWPLKHKTPAAQYLRMSTEHQQYSPDNQAATIKQYSEEKGYDIVATYIDEGRSGVKISGRKGLLQLLDDVEAGRSGFAAILVYDVSRWGRFQNPDEAAVYEVRCRWAGVPVHYVAEPFDNYGSVMKTLKRAMAAEYSRELSAKVTEGHRRMLDRGFHEGGFPSYGLQRVLVDADGRRKQILRFREHKYLQSDRVVLEPGPPEHVAIVNEVYTRYLAGELQCSLVSALNDRGDFQLNGRPWTEATMRRMLSSECYIGNVIWGQHDGKLGRVRRAMPKSNWIRKEGAFPHVVEPSLFWLVQAEIARRKSHYSTVEMLVGLTMLLKKHGTLNNAMIDKAVGVASEPSIARRFGSLKAAYAQVGFQSVANNKYTKINKRISALTGKIGRELGKQLDIVGLQHVGTACHFEREGHRVILLLGRYIDRMSGPEQWYVQWEALERATIAVVGLMDPQNIKVRAYHVVTGADVFRLQQRKCPDDGRCLQDFALPDLSACRAKVIDHMTQTNQQNRQNRTFKFFRRTGMRMTNGPVALTSSQSADVR